MAGQTVCRMHGGSSPQALEAARIRLAALVDPSIDVLEHLLKKPRKDALSLAAAKDSLDRNGLKAPSKVEVEGSLRLEDLTRLADERLGQAS